MCIIGSMSEIIIHCEGCGEGTNYVWISEITAACIECGHQEHL